MGRFFPRRKTESSSSNISGDFLKTTMSSVSRRYTGRMSFSRLFKCWLRDSSYLVRSFLVTRMQEDRTYASARSFLPENAIVTHRVTCQGRDHLVNVQSGRQSLVIVKRLITPHRPSYHNAVGIILGDFDMCEPEERRFNVWNQTFIDGDTGKTALFHSFFPHVLEIAQPDDTRRDSSALGIIRTLSRTDRIFINLPLAEARDFHCHRQVFENLGNRSVPSDHAAVRLVIQKPSNQGQQCKRIPSWMSKHPVFVLF